MPAVDWPDLEELKRVLDVEGSDWDDHLDGLMTAGIDRVKADVGDWDESVDSPTPRLAKAALRAAALLQTNAASQDNNFERQRPSFIDTDKVYTAYLKGYRRRFGFS